MDIKLRAVLGETARPLVVTERVGKDRAYTNRLIGITAISIDQGQLSSIVPWAIRGTEAEISSDIADHICAFELDCLGVESCVMGHYVLRNRSRQAVAEARVDSWAAGKFQVYVRGKARADVVKLFELIRDGETAPEAAGGRRGLIRNLREQIAELSVSAGELVDYKVAYEQQVKDNLGYLNRIDMLKAENAELKKMSKLTPWQFFWRSFFGTNDPQVA